MCGCINYLKAPKDALVFSDFIRNRYWNVNSNRQDGLDIRIKREMSEAYECNQYTRNG